jgi:FG-GAP-like repeat
MVWKIDKEPAMARFEGLASIRRALSIPNGAAQLDIKPDGLNWQWSFVSADRARQALACGLTAISGGWKLYVSLPDDPNSNVLEIIGLTKTPDRPDPAVLYQGAGFGIGGYDLADPADRAFGFDYNNSGRLDHFVLYRPGQGTIWILRNNAGTFTPVYQQGAPGNGIGGYNLADPADRVFAFDYNSSGRLDHLVLYRPGQGTIWILRNNAGTFTPVYQQGAPGNGIGGYNLADPADRIFAFDYNNIGRRDHLVLYRPGQGTIWILQNSAGTFTPVYAMGAPGTGIRGYDLADARDRAFGFDYHSNGRPDNLVLYRPGTGTIWILNSLNA